MESPRFNEPLERFIERAPQIIEVIVLANGAEGFSIRQVQDITDDLVCLDDTEFVRKYGLEALFEALAEAEAAGELEPESPYTALARHLSPDDPDAGTREIDRLILADKRARSGRYNRQRGALILGPLAIALGITGFAGPALIRAVDPAMSWPLPTLPPLASLTVLVVGIALVWRVLRWDYQVPDRPLPAAVAQWLTANGHEHGVRYWDEIYWPDAKRHACRREVLGFTFWTKLPPPASEWPMLRIHDDPERNYWEHGAGRPVSERYRRTFMVRIERWNDLAYRLNWTGWALVAAGLVTTAILQFFVPGMASYALKLALATGFIGLTIPLGLWMPPGIRRRWFGPLPADAESYRDFLLART